MSADIATDTHEFVGLKLGLLPAYPGGPLLGSPREVPPPAGYVWFFDLLTKELHQTKLAGWQISAIVIGLERMIPPEDYIAAVADAKVAILAKLNNLKADHPDSIALVAICDGLLAMLNEIWNHA